MYPQSAAVAVGWEYIDGVKCQCNGWTQTVSAFAAWLLQPVKHCAVLDSIAGLMCYSHSTVQRLRCSISKSYAHSKLPSPEAISNAYLDGFVKTLLPRGGLQAVCEWPR